MRDNGKIDLIRLFSVPEARTTSEIGLDVQRIIIEISKYKPDIIIADNGDSGDKVLKLIKHFGKGKVFGCTYKSSPKSTGQIIPVFSENADVVTVDKLMQNKMYIDALKSKEIRTYSIIDNELQTYLRHWKNVVIRDQEDDKTGDFYQVITRRGDDHYAQSSVYSYIGLKRLIDLVRTGGTPLQSTFVNTIENTENLNGLYDK